MTCAELGPFHLFWWSLIISKADSWHVLQKTEEFIQDKRILFDLCFSPTSAHPVKCVKGRVCYFNVPLFYFSSCCCHGLTPQPGGSIQQPSPTQPLPHSKKGERIRKVGKSVGWDKASPVGEVKAVQESSTKHGIRSPLPMGSQVFRPSQESLHPSHLKMTWEGECHDSSLSVWNTPWVTGISHPNSDPSNSLCTPAPSLLGWGAEKALALSKYYLELTKTSLYYPCHFQHKFKAQPRSSY